ncbi:homeodomain-only protein [Amia ocellicauda]|uniref:homeodomain-only protein n=1 Tax=Amia ocellicauda TaxID=2972642 RepID=UPI003463EBAC
MENCSASTGDISNRTHHCETRATTADAQSRGMASAGGSSRRTGDGVDILELSEEQVKALEENFMKVSKHPDATTLMLIAAECGLSEEDTAKWFKLRNAQWRKSEGLPAQLGSVKD